MQKRYDTDGKEVSGVVPNKYFDEKDEYKGRKRVAEDIDAAFRARGSPEPSGTCNQKSG